MNISGNIRVGGFFSDKDRNAGYVEENDPYVGGKGNQFWRMKWKDTVSI